MCVHKKIIPPISVVAYTGNAWESPLATLRIVGPLQQAGITLIKGNEGQDIYPERVTQADLVIVQREFPRNEATYHQIVTQARAQGKPVVYDLDDLLLALPENHPDRLSHYYTEALIPMMRAITEVDAVTTCAQPLCEALRSFNPSIWLLPNYIDDRLWTMRDHKENTAGSAPVIIGYMGGDSHAPDVEMIAPALTYILEKYGTGVLLRFYGLRPMPGLVNKHNVEWIPLSEYNYAKFAEYFAAQECDIYIAPLQDNLFNRCKSSIKFLEYSASATPGVYSRISPYEEVIRQGENGFLASNLQEWEAYLSQLIEAPELRVGMGLQAQQTVKEDWLLSEHAGKWLETYLSICSQQVAPKEGLIPELKIYLGIAQQVESFNKFEREEMDQTIQALTQRASQAEGALLQVNARLGELERSKTWKLAQFFRRCRFWLFPKGSRRERLGIRTIEALRGRR